MTEERRSTSSVGARMRSGASWGHWSSPADAGPNAAASPAAAEPAAEPPLAPERTPAIHDVLTGLPNRVLLLDRLDGALKRAARTRQRLAVAVVEIAELDKLAAGHGPGATDALLALTAQRLVGTLRACDTVARLGAREFAVVLEGVHSATVAAQLGRKLLAVVTQPCTVLADADGRPVAMTPGASIGVAVSPDHGRLRDTLLAAATLAMVRARRHRAGTLLHGQEAGPAAAAR